MPGGVLFALVGIGFFIGSIIAVIRALSFKRDDPRRWVPAILGGVIAYWVVLLAALVIGAKIIGQNHGQRLNYALGGAWVLVAVYAACVFTVVVAPRPGWKIMSYISGAAALLWTAHDYNDGAFTYEMAGCVLGVGLAYATGFQLFGRQNASAPNSN